MLKLSMIPFIPWAVYMIADKKGFWEKLGLTVELCIHPSEEDYVTSMDSMSSDMYPLPLSSVLELSARGNRFVATGFFDLANGHKKIIVKNEFKGMLKGKKIICYSDEIATRYFLSRFLSIHHLFLCDVELLFCNSEELADRFVGSDIAACLVFQEPVEKILETTDSEIAFTTGAYTEPFTVAVPFERHTLELEKKLPDFIRGRMAAASWINDPANTDEFSDLVIEYLFNGSFKAGKKKIMQLYEQLKTPRAEELLDLNRGGAKTVFNQLTQACLANGMITKECQKDFKIEQILKNQALIHILKGQA